MLELGQVLLLSCIYWLVFARSLLNAYRRLGSAAVFEEAGIPPAEFTNTYGLMSLGGIPKPGWRAFQLLHQHAGASRHPVTVTEHTPDPPVPPPPPVPAVCHTIPGLNLGSRIWG